MAEWTIFGQSFFTVVQALVSGVLAGGLYALVALGIVVINKSSGVFNFAHGWMMFIGGLVFWQFYQNAPSNQMVYTLSGLGTLIILGVIASLGLTGGAVAVTRPAPAFVEVKPKPKWQVYLGKIRDKISTRLYERRFLVVVIVGVVLWYALGYGFIQDKEPIVRGAIGAFIASLLVGLIIERFTIRPLLGQPLLTAILMTLAVGFILEGTIQIVWGEQARALNIFKEPDRPNYVALPENLCLSQGYEFVPPSNCQIGTISGRTLPNYKIQTADWLGNDIQIERDKIWGFGISLATFAGFAFLFQYTSIGLAMRATAENQVLAESVGLRVRLILAVAWALVAVMAGIAGILQGLGATLSAISVPFVALRVFPAVLLGGLDSIKGALVGGIILGIVEQLAIRYISGNAAVNMAPYVVLMIVLLFRPEGLFGQRRIDRV